MIPAGGIQCAQKYLQHIGDNFFSPVYRDADKLQIYYFSTSNINLIKEASKCSNMFEHGLKKDIPSPKGSFPGFKYDSQLYPGGRMQHGSLFGML